MSQRRFSVEGRRTISAAATLLTAILAGCAQQAMDPFRDPAAEARTELTTASADGYRRATPPEQQSRDWPDATVYYHQTAVTHWPVYFENPLIDKGNDPIDPQNRDLPDQQFAGNNTDIIGGFYGPARFFLNTIGLPISLFVTPPGTVMASDGKLSEGALGYDHDAARASVDYENPELIQRGVPTASVSGAEPIAPAANDAAQPSAPATVQAAPPANAAPPSGTTSDVLVLPAR